jgi:thymidylate synthase
MNTSIYNEKFINATHAFESLYNNIMITGEEFAGTKAIFNVAFTLENSQDKIITTPQRKFNQDYAEYEWEWYKKGDRDAKEISEKAKIWKQMMVPGTTEVNSNYGYFWNYNEQLHRVIKDLKQNKETRRAIVVHYILHDLDRYKYDTPCNDVLNFYVRNGKLELTVFARSIDLVFGFCNDQYTFAKLMEYVSEKTGYPVGAMHFFITNLHIYPRHFDLLTK